MTVMTVTGSRCRWVSMNWHLLTGPA
jgi:hypothetical protein